MPNYDLIIIGAGISGMTAALGASKAGIKKILLIERENNLGGIINQCIHNGFGKKFLGESVTGPEYIEFIKQQLEKAGIEYILNTNVLDVTSNKIVTYVNAKEGVKDITAGAIIFAMGAQERYSGNVMISTNTLTGIFTVGEAHRIINIEGYLPGKNAIIVAKDRWGFLLARRLIIEGGKVEGVILEGTFDEINTPEISSIISGFNIPIIERARIVEIAGGVRISKVKVLNIDDECISEKTCDCLLLSVGFVPETAKLKKLKIAINEETLGPKVDEYETSIAGFFACGNIIYGEEALNMNGIDGIDCGIKAAEYVKKYIY